MLTVQTFRHFVPDVFICGHCRLHAHSAGIYARSRRVPGRRKKDFSPSMKIEAKAYRNLALHRPAYQSSSYDYNCTAQLITDGIKETQLPSWIVVTTSSDGVVKRNERGWILDRNPMTRKI